MDSLRIGEYIFSVLSGSLDLKGLVGDKIFPLVVKNEVNSPFIVYNRLSLTPSYTKDCLLEDTVRVEIQCVANSYSEAINIMCLVRDRLEGLRDKPNGVERILIESCTEEYSEDAFIESMIFSIKIQ